MKKTVNIMIFNPFFAFYNKTLPAGNSYVMSNNLKSNHWGCSVKKALLRNFAKLTGKHLYQSLFFNKATGLSLQKCFPMNFAKFLRTLFSQNTSGGCFCNLNTDVYYLRTRTI